ncbi:MAG TPA: hypothetical protein PLB99_01210 [Thermotogota bacterium]|nr:hypothetical protein [Thermotogota bacterium]
MKTVFFMLFVMFFPIGCIAGAEDIYVTADGYRILLPRYEELMKDVTPFCIGSVSDEALLFEYGLFLSTITKTNGADACVIGYAEPLDLTVLNVEGNFNETIAPFFSISSYQCAQIVEAVANGLLAGGVFPVLSAKYGLDDAFIDNLKFRKVFPAIFTDNREYSEYRLLSLALPVIDDFRANVYNRTMLKELPWSWIVDEDRFPALREEILLNTIVQLKALGTYEDYEIFSEPLRMKLEDKAAVFIDDPRLIELAMFKTGYLVHSDEEFVLERIRLICKGIYTARGKKNW